MWIHWIRYQGSICCWWMCLWHLWAILLAPLRRDFNSLRQILLRWRKRSWSVADWPASLLPTPCWSAVARWSWWTSLPSAVEIPPRQPAASTVQRHRPRRPRRLRRLAVLVASCDLFFVMSCACHLSMFRSNAAQECTRSPWCFSSCLEVVLWLLLIAS